MGLGKTFSALLLLLAIHRQPDEGPALIVTKKSLVPHWETEIKQVIKPQHALRCPILDKSVCLPLMDEFGSRYRCK